MKTNNLFIGHWIVVSAYYKTPEGGWTLFERYGSKRFLWKFVQERVLKFPSGEHAYEGRLYEHFEADPEEITDYAYYPADGQLYIDRSDYGSDGFCNACINERYRVEHIRENEYWLYYLEDVGDGSEDHRFKMKVKKFKPSSDSQLRRANTP